MLVNDVWVYGKSSGLGIFLCCGVEREIDERSLQELMYLLERTTSTAPNSADRWHTWVPNGVRLLVQESLCL